MAHERLGAAGRKLEIYHSPNAIPPGFERAQLGGKEAATEDVRDALQLIDDASEMLRTGRRPRYRSTP